MSISRAQLSNSLETHCKWFLRVCQPITVKIQLLWKKVYIFLEKCFEWVKNRFTGNFSRRANPVLENQPEDSALALISSERVEIPNQATELRAALQGISTFFIPPSNEECIDDQSGKVYRQPDYSHLLSLGCSQFSMDEYSSFGVCRKIRKTPPGKEGSTLCDLIFFRKHEDQMRFENPSSFSIASLVDQATNAGERVKVRMEKQNERCGRLYIEIRQKAREWGYDQAYFLSDPKEMRTWGFSDSDVKTIHGIVFSYKEAVLEPERIEEIFE